MKAAQRWRAVAEAAALVWLLLLVAACMTCGCGRMNPQADRQQGLGVPKVYEVHIHPGARSIVNIGNAANQTPLYQAADQGGPQPAEGNGATRVTTPSMPATATTGNAGTAAGENVLLIVNDGAKRTSETDAALTAAMQAGVTGSNLGQTAPQAQRQSTSSGTGGPGTATTSTTDTTAIAPAIPVAPGGTAAVTNPSNAAAGPASQPGPVGGASGASTTTTDRKAEPGSTKEASAAVPPSP